MMMRKIIFDVGFIKQADKNSNTSNCQHCGLENIGKNDGGNAAGIRIKSSKNTNIDNSFGDTNG
ncbi:hypothetical protein VNF293_16540 [Atlantibacter hermannii]